MNGPAVRAQLRLANRDAWRHRSRSFLIVATLTFPVAGLVAAITLVHALSVPPATKATWRMGAADGVVQLADGTPTAHLVPAGSRALYFNEAPSRVAGPDHLLRTPQVSDLDYTHPLAAGMVEQQHGRAPRSADEAAVSRAFADAAGLKLGSRLTLRDVGSRTVTVVGIAVTPIELSDQVVWLSPGALGRPSEALVSLPAGLAETTWARALDGNVLTRDSVLHPPKDGRDPVLSQQSVGLKVLVSGLALLEAILMASAAFGVGARRSQRDLALVAATGGDAGQVRAVVLTAAIVLGAVAGVVGVGLGLVAAWALLPEAQNIAGHSYTGLHPRPVELAAAFLLGIVTALVSAWLPARGAARAPVVTSLSGRRGIVRSSPARVGFAVATAALGTLLCAWAGRTPSLGSRQFDAILLFAVIAELGFAGCAPALVGLAGRCGGRLPLTARMSLRDIARNRSRTGPAVAAIMATLSGVVAMGVYVASEHARQVRDFTAELPATSVALRGDTAELTPDLVRQVAAAFPTTSVSSYGDGQGGSGAYAFLTDRTGHVVQNVTVAGPGFVQALGIPGSAADLAAGKAVVIVTGEPVGARTATLEVTSAKGAVSTVTVPATVARVGVYQGLGAVLVSPETASRIGLSDRLDERLLTMTRKPTQQEIDAANGILLEQQSGSDSQIGLEWERGLNDDKLLLVPLALLAISTLVTLGVTAISTALSAAESRSDFATLGAVGAAPSVRRRLATAQAATLALLGGALGIAAGLVPISAVIAVRSDVLTFTIPWQVVALALVGVPAIAGAGAGLFTRSRLPMTRQLN